MNGKLRRGLVSRLTNDMASERQALGWVVAFEHCGHLVEIYEDRAVIDISLSSPQDPSRYSFTGSFYFIRIRLFILKIRCAT